MTFKLSITELAANITRAGLADMPEYNRDHGRDYGSPEMFAEHQILNGFAGSLLQDYRYDLSEDDYEQLSIDVRIALEAGYDPEVSAPSC